MYCSPSPCEGEGVGGWVDFLSSLSGTAPGREQTSSAVSGILYRLRRCKTFCCEACFMQLFCSVQIALTDEHTKERRRHAPTPVFLFGWLYGL